VKSFTFLFLKDLKFEPTLYDQTRQSPQLDSCPESIIARYSI